MCEARSLPVSTPHPTPCAAGGSQAEGSCLGRGRGGGEAGSASSSEAFEYTAPAFFALST